MMWSVHSSQIFSVQYLRDKNKEYEWSMDASGDTHLPCFQHEGID